MDRIRSLPHLPQVPLRLHPEPMTRAAPTHLLQPDRHFRRHSAVLVHQIQQGLAGHTKRIGGLAESGHQDPRPVRVLRVNPALIPRFEEASQAFVPEVLDHLGGVTYR